VHLRVSVADAMSILSILVLFSIVFAPLLCDILACVSCPMIAIIHRVVLQDEGGLLIFDGHFVDVVGSPVPRAYRLCIVEIVGVLSVCYFTVRGELDCIGLVAGQWRWVDVVPFADYRGRSTCIIGC